MSLVAGRASGKEGGNGESLATSEMRIMWTDDKEISDDASLEQFVPDSSGFGGPSLVGSWGVTQEGEKESV